MLDDAVLEAARSRAESEGYGYQTVVNNTLRHALLLEKGPLGSLKNELTLSELKTLEKKLTDAVTEIHRLMVPDVQP